MPRLPDRGAAQVAADTIRAVMWEKSGIDRNWRGLRECIATLSDIHDRLPPGATEELNLCETAILIAKAALLERNHAAAPSQRLPQAASRVGGEAYRAMTSEMSEVGWWKLDGR